MYTFFLFYFWGGRIAAVEDDCFFFRNIFSVLGIKPKAVVLALHFYNWLTLFFLFFVFFDLDLDLSVLSLIIKLLSYLTLLTITLSIPSFLRGCILLTDNLFGFCDIFFLFSPLLFYYIALLHELLYLLLSYASFNLVVSSITIWFLLVFLLIECLLIKESLSCFLFVESRLNRFLFWLSG